MKACKQCGSPCVVPRRNLCREHYNEYQRGKYAANDGAEKQKAMYQKHASRRREESAKRKAENRERYSMLEWFRRQGVSVTGEKLDLLVDMKKAVNELKKTIDLPKNTFVVDGNVKSE